MRENRTLDCGADRAKETRRESRRRSFKTEIVDTQVSTASPHASSHASAGARTPCKCTLWLRWLDVISVNLMIALSESVGKCIEGQYREAVMPTPKNTCSLCFSDLVI